MDVGYTRALAFKRADEAWERMRAADAAERWEDAVFWQAMWKCWFHLACRLPHST